MRPRRSGPVLRLLTGLSIAGALHAGLNMLLLRRPPATPRPVRRPVTVVVPARNEERTIRSCLEALLAQQSIDDLRVLVVDDGSTDATADAVRSVGDPRLRLLTAERLPPGWLGKTWACATGIRAAAEEARTGEDAVLVFVDADVRLFPDGIAGAVAVLDDSGLDLVSPWPRPVAATLSERLVQPLAPWLWATTLPLRLAERSRRPSLAAANGQFLVLTGAGYRRAGGHAAVRGEVLDDLALLRAVKRAGGRGGPVDGSRLAACRMYEGWGALREGYTKSLWAAVGGSPAGSLAAAGVLTAVGVVPAVAALRGSPTGLVGYLAGVAGRAVVAIGTGSRTWPDPLAHPVSMLLLDGLLVRSVLARRRGTLTWRGRRLEVGER
jgi:glycosyl transferase family 2